MKKIAVLVSAMLLAGAVSAQQNNPLVEDVTGIIKSMDPLRARLAKEVGIDSDVVRHAYPGAHEQVTKEQADAAANRCIGIMSVPKVQALLRDKIMDKVEPLNVANDSPEYTRKDNERWMYRKLEAVYKSGQAEKLVQVDTQYQIGRVSLRDLSSSTISCQVMVPTQMKGRIHMAPGVESPYANLNQRHIDVGYNFQTAYEVQEIGGKDYKVRAITRVWPKG